MENKVTFDGLILNEIKLSQYNTCLLRLQNKKEFTKKDGTQGSSSCTMVVTVRDRLASEVAERFKRGDVVRVQGALQLKKTDKMDQEGKEIWEVWIRARTIDAIPNVTEGRPVSAPARQQPTQRPIQQQRPVQKTIEPEPNPQDAYGIDDLPF